MEDNPSTPTTGGEPPRNRDGPRETGQATREFRRTVSLIGPGIFVSTFAQTGVLGRLPLEFLLKGPLHINATDMAGFFALAALSWNIKPLAGLLSDSTPIFGTRRKHYLIISGAASAFFVWLLGAVGHTFAALAAVAIGLNVALMLMSTAVWSAAGMLFLSQCRTLPTDCQTFPPTAWPIAPTRRRRDRR